jgi:hypothetical protein
MVLLAGVLLAGGAHAQSILIEISTAGDTGVGDAIAEIEHETTGGPPTLRVVTAPAGASVYLDGRNRGITPLVIADVQPGNRLLRVQKDGYHEVREWIRAPSAGTLVVRIDLRLITGFLDVDVNPRDAVIFVGDQRVVDRFAVLPVGTHRLRVELFGYEPVSEVVRIVQGRVTRVTIELERSPFVIDDLEIWRPAFNPMNPGTIGTTRISYRVSARGTGEITVVDPAGTTVRSIPQGPFRDWDQQYRWDGTDDAGLPVPDGVYTVEVVGEGEDGRVEETTARVTIDRSILVRYRSVWGPTAGLLYAPTRSPLPAGQAQLTTTFGARLARVDEQNLERPRFMIPGRLAARIGLGGGFELFGYGGILARADPFSDRLTLGGALSWDPPALSTGPTGLGAGIAIGGMLERGGAGAGEGAGEGASVRDNPHGGEPGVFVSLPIALKAGSATFSVAPEYRFVAPGAGMLPDWHGVGYLRAGLMTDFMLDTAGLSAGLSAALRTGPLLNGLTVQPPVNIGAELHWILPRSSVALSVFAASDVTSATDFTIYGGLGLGVLF